MRGIISYGAYVPYHRLDRADIAGVFGGAPARGTRSVASYDEDTTTMGVEAARIALRSLGDGRQPDALWFATADPAYLDKTNATAIHAALRLDADRHAMDTGGAVRSGVGSLGAAIRSHGSVLVVAADLRGGLAAGADERQGGDGASAILVGDDADGAVIAQHLGSGSATAEFLDRWRTPGSDRSRSWEERFGETRYVPLGEQAWNAALKAAELSPDQIDRLIVTGLHSRSVRRLAGRLGASEAQPVDDLAATVGNTGTAHPGLLLAGALDEAEPGQTIALVVLADGADVHLFRATDAIAGFGPTRSVAAQVDAGGSLPYGKFLSWRGMVEVEPPNRPEPGRVSSSAAVRTEDWKFAFVGSRDRSSGMVHLPPARVSERGGAVDDMEPVPMADVEGTVVTYTVDRLVYSPSPPVVFAVVDFEGGGRVPIALTDVDADEVAMGDRVEMTFRRLFTADEIHNYFWKARPVRA